MRTPDIRPVSEKSNPYSTSPKQNGSINPERGKELIKHSRTKAHSTR